MQPPSRPLSRSHSAGNPAPARPPQTTSQGFPRPGPQNNSHQAAPRPHHPLQQQMNQSRPASGPAQASNSSSSGPHQTPPPANAQNGCPPSEGVGFFSARAVSQLAGPEEDEEPKLPTAPVGAHAFNPHAESPSIRKTPGIDHTKSKPLGRNGQHVAPAERNGSDTGSKNPGPVPISLSVGAGKSGAGVNSGGGLSGAGGQQQQQGPIAAQRGGLGNPQLSQVRRIGAPMGPGSPMANRGQYRPPTMKRPISNDGNGGTRPALTEVSTNGTVNTVTGAGDVKRQKMS